MPHPGAGWPSELLLDGVERGNDIGDPLLDLLFDDVEVEGVLTVVFSSEDVVLLVLTSELSIAHHLLSGVNLFIWLARFNFSSSPHQRWVVSFTRK